MRNSVKKLKTKSYKQRDNDSVHGKISYRVRKQLEQEGQKEVMEYCKDANRKI